MFTKKKNFIRSKRFKLLLKATSEVERYFSYPLDIEFCMTKNKLFLLQVRPIVLKKKNIIFSEKVISDKLHLEFKKIKKSFKQRKIQYIW